MPQSISTSRFTPRICDAKGDRKAYQAACRQALEKIRSEHDPDQLSILLWMCTVTPYSVQEAAQLADVAGIVLPTHEPAPTRDQLLAAGAALFRAGKLPEAREHLRQTLQHVAEGKPTIDPMSEVFTHLFLAMTGAQLGFADEADASFAEANRRAKLITPPCWVSKLQHKRLTEETRAKISDRSETALSRTVRGG
jgi:hypothetical protein